MPIMGYSEMAQQDIDLWKAYFSWTKIKQLVTQLDRKVFHNEDEGLDRYLNKPEILSNKFWRRKMGKWFPEDFEGFIVSFQKDVLISAGKYLSIEIGTGINRRSPYNEYPFLTEIDVKVSQRRESDIVLDELSPRMYSEICRDIELYFMRS